LNSSTKNRVIKPRGILARVVSRATLVLVAATLTLGGLMVGAGTSSAGTSDPQLAIKVETSYWWGEPNPHQLRVCGYNTDNIWSCWYGTIQTYGYYLIERWHWKTGNTVYVTRDGVTGRFFLRNEGTYTQYLDVTGLR
jgi:hypothetical protein